MSSLSQRLDNHKGTCELGVSGFKVLRQIEGRLQIKREAEKQVDICQCTMFDRW